MEPTMSTTAQTVQQPRTSSVVRDALSRQNQQISPARTAEPKSQYERMVRKLNVKPSAHEMLMAYTQV
ncbi:hypothetical protein EFK68_27210 [Pseudomonas aeruginosa]|uniref:Uncharacterized protein n=2 Tax=Pseudomonas TaxID=286 RepID=A0A241XEW7_PSEAI|nr:hypothetical protein APA88_33155 [Pseudomonas aeruginosa]OWK91334.1 hypothetical protein L999_028040 [Pseudomonas aeruginosa 148]KSQ21037.1 hypothetical protein APB28_12470 [Pseudomonas aeruginosa]OTH53963.1 hypothetical protein CAZ13_11705 [Pseudomonas aeruginosa]OTH71818.1 hypothetical protein CAZ25_12960 [Pseudomonas aeruginosa]